jgi:LysR family transcriptional regulator, benzoate and cis,cis-muconate-responsive activator of ben and cat genes
MLPSVRIEDLEAAIEVTECRHFTRAGEKLHRSQGAISKSMKRVESGMGVKLIDRSAHPVQPTRAAMVFRYHARRALDSLVRGLNAAQRIDGPDRSVLEVGYTSYLDLDVLAYLEHIGRSSDPGFTHQEHSSSTSEVIASVLSGKWDCGFIITPAATGNLVGIPIYRDPFGLALASGHPLAHKRKVRIEDLRNTPLILPARERNTGFRAWFMERCGTAGVRLQVAHEVGNPHEAWFMASHHAGAALIPRAATRNLAKGMTVFRPFAEDDLFAEVQLVFRDEPQSPMLASFVETVLRMRDRMRRGELQEERALAQAPPVPRPLVKPWKKLQSVPSDRHAVSA